MDPFTQVLDNQLELLHNRSVRTQGLVKKTSRKR